MSVHNEGWLLNLLQGKGINVGGVRLLSSISNRQTSYSFPLILKMPLDFLIPFDYSFTSNKLKLVGKLLWLTARHVVALHITTSLHSHLILQYLFLTNLFSLQTLFMRRLNLSNRSKWQRTLNLFIYHCCWESIVKFCPLHS